MAENGISHDKSWWIKDNRKDSGARVVSHKCFKMAATLKSQLDFVGLCYANHKF